MAVGVSWCHVGKYLSNLVNLTTVFPDRLCLHCTTEPLKAVKGWDLPTAASSAYVIYLYDYSFFLSFDKMNSSSGNTKRYIVLLVQYNMGILSSWLHVPVDIVECLHTVLKHE